MTILLLIILRQWNRNIIPYIKQNPSKKDYETSIGITGAPIKEIPVCVNLDSNHCFHLSSNVNFILIFRQYDEESITGVLIKEIAWILIRAIWILFQYSASEIEILIFQSTIYSNIKNSSTRKIICDVDSNDSNHCFPLIDIPTSRSYWRHVEH